MTVSPVEVAEQRGEITRQWARETVARVFGANRGKSELDISFALGAASATFNGVREKRIWTEEIQRYREDHKL